MTNNNIIINNFNLVSNYYINLIKKGDKTNIIKLELLYNNKILVFKKMILFMNNLDILPRDNVIQSLNSISTIILNEKQEVVFLNIIKEFEFEDDDKICTIIKLLSNKLKN
jgi:hypothetical protein